MPLFATDEPADIAGVNATAVLVRLVKQGVAEWYRLQLKEKIWKGFAEHSAAGWNIGIPPHGYAADRHPHPNPAKAAQGHVKTRLVLDPVTAPAVTAIFTWRTVDKLGVPTIAARLNADPAAYPPPGGKPGWMPATVYSILANPKYTGHMVFGVKRTRNGRKTRVPMDQWLWSPEPSHPAIVDMDTWHDAQKIGEQHSTSRDPRPNPADAPRAYRGRVICRDCQRRMSANPFPNATYWRCHHDPNSPRHQAANPDHPRTVQVPESRLDQITGIFLASRLFSPGRAELLAAQLPATDAEATARRDQRAAALAAQIRKLDAQQNAQITALEDIPDSPAAPAMRARIRDRFAELHTQRTQAETELDALTTARPRAADPALLDELPYLGDILPALPPALKTRLFAAVDLTVLWNKTDGQTTVRATITDATLAALPLILDPSQDGYHDTADTPRPLAICHDPPYRDRWRSRQVALRVKRRRRLSPHVALTSVERLGIDTSSPPSPRSTSQTDTQVSVCVSGSRGALAGTP
jgi:site-specific DNA recombinase